MSSDSTDRSTASPWSRLPTEERHAGSATLDQMATSDVVALLLAEDRLGIELAQRQSAAISRAAEWVAEALGQGGDLLLVGAGTSGRLGILEAAECPPTFGTDPERIRAVIAGGKEAVFQAREGAEDRAEDGRSAVAGLRPGDLVLGISASSVTAFVRGALEGARARGCRTVLLTCASATEIGDVADLLLALSTGPEVLTGSTRLKAGSATKAVLNAITTAAMVRLGKVYENLMVDLRPGSAKLQDRAIRILEAAGGVARAAAEQLYREADRELKTAIVMARCGLPAEGARQRLEQAGGHVRGALQEQ